jgi:preprotein translocase subunit SecY
VQLVELTNLTGNPDPVKIMTPGKIIFLIASFIFVVRGSILITQAQRRIPIHKLSTRAAVGCTVDRSSIFRSA